MRNLNVREFLRGTSHKLNVSSAFFDVLFFNEIFFNMPIAIFNVNNVFFVMRIFNYFVIYHVIS